MVTIIIAHPNEMITASLEMLLATTDDLCVLGVAHDSVAMVASVVAFRPNLLLLSADLHNLPTALNALQEATFNSSLLFFYDRPATRLVQLASKVAPVAFCSTILPAQLLAMIRASTFTKDESPH